MKVEDMPRLQRNEMMMVTCLCGVTLNNTKSDEDLRDHLGLKCTSHV